MEKKISYINRTFEDYRQALVDFSKEYYPDLATEYDDASVGSWLIDINAACADNLSYHIDRVFQETNINSANERSSVLNIARNNGFKVPGPKGAMAEVRFTCTLPVAVDADENERPDATYAPIIKKGTKLAAASQIFELVDDVVFPAENSAGDMHINMFDKDGNPDCTIIPVTNYNGDIVKYEVSKLGLVVAGETKVYSQVFRRKDIKPFMEILLPASNVMNIESIVVRQGTEIQSYPTYGEFFIPNETSTAYTGTTRFFEVDNLLQQKRWADSTDENEVAKKHQYAYLNTENELIPAYSVVKGEWKPLYHKFVTEYTDKGFLKITFGAGIEANVDTVDIRNAADFTKYQIGKIIKNDALGILPEPDTTIYVLYRAGGGSSSNVAAGSINTITELKLDWGCNVSTMNAAVKNAVRTSIKASNTTPSVSGKDAPSTEEIKWMTKYNSGAQERCVTTKDYENRILLLPPKYGTPFRVGVTEENNKIMVYLLGLDFEGHLDSKLPAALVENIKSYLKEYRSINDYVEMKSGKIINLSFEVDVYTDKNYNKTDIASAIINVIRDYMDINKHNMGDDIFVGDIEKEISKVDGVLNLVDFRVYNEIGSNYSSNQTTQEIVSVTECTDKEETEILTGNRLKIDLDASEGILYSDGDSMLEIKYPQLDIRVKIKER